MSSDIDPSELWTGDPMDPNPMHYIYKAVLLPILKFGTDFTAFTNQLNIESQNGWQPDMIVKWNDTNVLVIFIGTSAEGPDHGNAAPA